MFLRTAQFILLTLALLMRAAAPAHGQSPPSPPQDPLMALMAAQPPVDVWSPVVSTTSFDPPVVRPGDESTYHVTFNAIEAAVQWPDHIAASPPLEMRLSARGQIVYQAGTNLEPRTAINYHVRASSPGSFAVREFRVNVNGQSVTVPEARLEVAAATAPSNPRLVIELAETNVFAGQRVNVRVLQPAANGNVVEALSQVRLNGNGFLVDESTAHQTVTTLTRAGRTTSAYIYETTMIPLAVGALSISAQGFTAGNQFNGPIVIQGQVTIPGGSPRYVLLDSDPVAVQVRPLPPEGELPGFTGAIGNFTSEPPKLATNSVRVGEPVKLTVTVHGEGGLARLIGPPSPRAPDWQVFGPTANDAASAPDGQSGEVRTFTYTLIPLREEARATPAIPFSCFDAGRASYVDLTIPPVPVTVKPGATPADAQGLLQMSEAASGLEQPLTLNGLATTSGRTAGSLVPLQERTWFWFVQFAPVTAFTTLWVWDRRRRYLEQHPDILLRRHARRALHREWRALRHAADTGDAQRFAACAVNAMRVVCAPHFPAEPRALVCGDVLQVLNGTERSNDFGDVVRRLFAATDASRFATTSGDATALLPLQSELEHMLEELEARL